MGSYDSINIQTENSLYEYRKTRYALAGTRV